MEKELKMRWLARTLAVLTMLMTFASASAWDDPWWRNHPNGVDIKSSGDGHVVIEYVSYCWGDVTGGDDWLQSLNLYLVRDKEEINIMNHHGGYWDRSNDYNDGYGRQYYHNDATLHEQWNHTESVSGWWFYAKRRLYNKRLLSAEGWRQ